MMESENPRQRIYSGVASATYREPISCPAWIRLDLIIRNGLTQYFEDISGEKFDELRLFLESFPNRIRLSYSRNSRLTVSCPVSPCHSNAAAQFIYQGSKFNVRHGSCGARPITAGYNQKVQFLNGSRNSGMPDFHFKVFGGTSSNVIGLINHRSRSTDQIGSFVQEGLDYITHTTNVLSVLLVWVDDQDQPRQVGLLLAEIRRVAPAVGFGLSYLFQPMVSFGNHALSADVRNGFVQHTVNRTALSCAGAAAPITPAGIVGVGFGGPACNAGSIPAYEYAIPGNIVLALDNTGILLAPWHPAAGAPPLPAGQVPSMVIDLFDIQQAIFDF